MTKAETGEFLFDDLRELAANHAQQKTEFEKLIPENISLGLFVVRIVAFSKPMPFKFRKKTSAPVSRSELLCPATSGLPRA